METAEEIAKALSLICVGVIFAGGIAAVLWFRKKEREFKAIQPVSRGRYWGGKGDYDKVKDKPEAIKPEVDPEIEEAAKLLQYRPEVKQDSKLHKVHRVNQYLAWSQALDEKAAASKQNVPTQDVTVDEDTEEEPEDDGTEIGDACDFEINPAAAPDLLRALQDAVGIFHVNGADIPLRPFERQWMTKAKAAIEKATQQPQAEPGDDADIRQEHEDDGSEIEAGGGEDTSPEEKRLTPEEMKAQADLFLTGFVGYSDAKHEEAVLSLPPCGNFTWAQRRMIIGIDPSAVHLAAKQFGYLEQQWPCRTLVSTDATPEIITNVDEPCPHEADFFRYALATTYDYLVLSRNRMMPPTQEHDLNVERAIVCAYAMCYKLAESHKDSLYISDTKS